MNWPYHFLDLSDDQKDERRRLLDFYANLAQLSPLVLLLGGQLYFFACWLHRKRTDLRSPSPSHLKEGRLGHGRTNGGARSWRTRVSVVEWWFRERVEVRGVYLGGREQLVCAGGWMGWLLVLCFAQTGDDYLHLTKRFAILAASQLPFHYLLAMKSPSSPIQFLTRSSHEKLNPFHQNLGRIIVFMLQLHGALYLNFFLRKHLLGAKIQEFYILCGVVGIACFTAIGTSALGFVREWNYRVFYILHVVLAGVWMPVLYFHSPHIRVYLFEAAVIYALNVVLRRLDSKTVSGTLARVPNTSLVKICISLTDLANPRLRKWRPGQHGYLSLAGHPVSRTFRSNPFSLASIPSVDGKLRFYARILDGNTATLAHQAASITFKHHLTIEGPYGVGNHSHKLLEYERVLFVAGGVGATFIIPLYRQLLADLSPSKGSYRRQKVSFVWAARGFADVAWALAEDVEDQEGFRERLKLYFTQGAEGDGGIPRQSMYAETEDGMEMKSLLSDESANDSGVALPAASGRPDLKRIVEETFSHSSSEKVAIFVCGPRGLSQSLRKEVTPWIKRGREVWFWEESFAL